MNTDKAPKEENKGMTKIKTTLHPIGTSYLDMLTHPVREVSPEVLEDRDETEGFEMISTRMICKK